ncbi:MAG: FkbM family methyltransferase [Candidatus Atribacteria bacterium]|nr:FkbM family methyltransferase [Candidatus Atribacteria bacterium]
MNLPDKKKIFEKIITRIRRLIKTKIFRSKKSFSQSGEDIIIQYVLNSMNILNPNYLDIGANHPVLFNNTYLFYKNNCRGICVEPNPVLAKIIKKKRSKDIVINKGISAGFAGAMKFYVFSSHTLSTFSKEDVNNYISNGEKLLKTIDVEVIPLNELINKLFKGITPDIISIDVEGWDFDILKTLDFEKYRPAIICAETLTYSPIKKEQKKNQELIKFLLHKNYFLYADTYINSIFVDKYLYFK